MPRNQTRSSPSSSAAPATRSSTRRSHKAGRRKDPTIGGVATAAILAGKPNDQVLARVMKRFPKCHTTRACISWYRKKLRAAGALDAPRKQCRLPRRSRRTTNNARTRKGR